MVRKSQFIFHFNFLAKFMKSQGSWISILKHLGKYKWAFSFIDCMGLSSSQIVHQKMRTGASGLAQSVEHVSLDRGAVVKDPH